MFFVILDSCGELPRAATSRLYVSTILPFEYLLPLLSQEGSPTGRGGLNMLSFRAMVSLFKRLFRPPLTPPNLGGEEITPCASVIPFIHATKLRIIFELSKYFANFFH